MYLYLLIYRLRYQLSIGNNSIENDITDQINNSFPFLSNNNYNNNYIYSM